MMMSSINYGLNDIIHVVVLHVPMSIPSLTIQDMIRFILYYTTSARSQQDKLIILWNLSDS